MSIEQPMYKNEDRKRTFSREKPFIPRLNLDSDYLEYKTQERDIKDLQHVELNIQLQEQALNQTTEERETERNDLHCYQDDLEVGEYQPGSRFPDCEMEDL